MTENKSNVEPQTYLLVRKWLIAKKALCDSSQRGTHRLSERMDN